MHVHRCLDTQEVFIDTAGEGSLTLERQEGSDEAVMQLLRSVSDQATFVTTIRSETSQIWGNWRVLWPRVVKRSSFSFF
jgi:oxalate decarboxylase/phosphoglucose isomerase-like protein (cupin superfamily)